jgi:hypothetical protein
MLNECIVCGEPPWHASDKEIVDFVMDYGDFAVTHKRSDRAKVLLRYRKEVADQFQEHDHVQEWKPVRFGMFRKTGRPTDEKVSEIKKKIRELDNQGKTQVEIIAEIRRLFPGRANYPQDVARGLGSAKPKK